MLTQAEADALIRMAKKLASQDSIQFPTPGEIRHLAIVSLDERDELMVDINRKSRIRLSKYTYQERYRLVEILVRLDVDGRPHTNPDGEEIPCPHRHLYREGFADRWAIPAPADKFANPTNMQQSFVDFLKFCNIDEIPVIAGVLF